MPVVILAHPADAVWCEETVLGSQTAGGVRMQGIADVHCANLPVAGAGGTCLHKPVLLHVLAAFV